MTLKEFQEESKKLIAKDLRAQDYRKYILYLTMGFTSETGEIANLFKKAMQNGEWPTRDTKNREVLHEELGDALWYLIQLIKETGGDVEVIMEKNIQKRIEAEEKKKQV